MPRDFIVDPSVNLRGVPFRLVKVREDFPHVEAIRIDALARRFVGRRLSADQLEHEDAEAEGVDGGAELAVADVVHREVDLRALDRRDEQVRALTGARAAARQPKVPDLGLKVAVKEDVAALDVAVDDGRLEGVQVH